MKKKIIGSLLFVSLLLAGCGSDEGNKKKDVEKMVEVNRVLVAVSDDVQETVYQTILDFEEESMGYESLKNILKTHQDVQLELKENLLKQTGTAYREEVTALFVEVTDQRVKQYDMLLGLVRQQDEDALKKAAETLQKADEEIKRTNVSKVNVLLEEKKVAKIDAMEK